MSLQWSVLLLKPSENTRMSLRCTFGMETCEIDFLEFHSWDMNRAPVITQVGIFCTSQSSQGGRSEAASTQVCRALLLCIKTSTYFQGFHLVELFRTEGKSSSGRFGDSVFQELISPYCWLFSQTFLSPGQTHILLQLRHLRLTVMFLSCAVYNEMMIMMIC